MSQTLVDYKLGLNSQARAILSILADQEPTMATWDDDSNEYLIETATYAWYNGRERGFCLVVHHPKRILQHNLYLTVAECRSSDDIVIRWWIGPMYFNPPTPREMCELPLEKIHTSTIPVYGMSLVVEHITRVIKEFLVSEEDTILVGGVITE